MNLAVALVALLLLAPSVTAQTGLATTGTSLPVAPRDAIPGPDVPAPPRAVFQATPKHAPAPIPVGTGGNKEPDSPESIPGGLSPIAAPGDFTTFVSSAVRPSGAFQQSVCEPSPAINRDTAFMVGNRFAAVSLDSGRTWSHLNPYTLFPAADGGFQGDQRAIYVPSRDITVWLLQYAYSPLTLRNTHRLAISRGRDNLRSGIWYFYDLQPQDFGYGLQTWFDFPDLAFGNTNLYVSTNVIDAAGGSGGGSLVWRVPLDGLRDRVAVAPQFQRSTVLGANGSYRWVQGATSVMYFATHNSTTSLRVYTWAEGSGQISWIDKTVATWSNAHTTAPGPDGRDWLTRLLNRVQTGYANAGEIGFLWVSAPIGTRPFAFVRAVRLQPPSMVTIQESDIWATGYAYAYPCLAVNARGHLGGTLEFGGGQLNPSCVGMIVDDFHPAWPPELALLRVGTSGPSNGWGDYLTAMPHPIATNTWVASGQTQQGGPADNQIEPRWVWFGRERDEPVWIDLAVTSTPAAAAGMQVVVNETDRLGFKDGATPFTRSYAPRQGYEITAPRTFAAGGIGWVFDRWVVNGVLQPVDQTTAIVSDMGTTDGTAEARCLQRRTLTVTSLPTGAVITASPPDVSGAGSVTTNGLLGYKHGAVAVLTAPAVLGTRTFRRWTLDGFPMTAGVRMLSVTMSADRTAQAEFGIQHPGALTPFGTACPGSNGVPAHTATAGNGPQIGQPVTYGLASGPASSVTLFVIGFSRTSWLGLPLPLPVPQAPGCSIYTELASALAAPVSAQGNASVQLPIPDDASLIGGRLYTQCWSIDPTANALGFTFSNAMETSIGGWTFN